MNAANDKDKKENLEEKTSGKNLEDLSSFLMDGKEPKVVPKNKTTEEKPEVLPEDKAETESKDLPEAELNEEKPDVLSETETEEETKDVSEPDINKEEPEALPEDKMTEEESGISSETKAEEESKDLSEAEITEEKSETLSESKADEEKTEPLPETDINEKEPEILPEDKTTEEKTGISPETNADAEESKVLPETDINEEEPEVLSEDKAEEESKDLPEVEVNEEPEALPEDKITEEKPGISPETKADEEKTEISSETEKDNVTNEPPRLKLRTKSYEEAKISVLPGEEEQQKPSEKIITPPASDKISTSVPGMTIGEKKDTEKLQTSDNRDKPEISSEKPIKLTIRKPSDAPEETKEKKDEPEKAPSSLKPETPGAAGAEKIPPPVMTANETEKKAAPKKDLPSFEEEMTFEQEITKNIQESEDHSLNKKDEVSTVHKTEHAEITPEKLPSKQAPQKSFNIVLILIALLILAGLALIVYLLLAMI